MVATVKGEIKMKAIVQLVILVFVAGVFWQNVQAQPLSACEQLQFGDGGKCADEDIVSGSSLVSPGQVNEPQSEGFFGNGECLTQFGYVSVGARLCMTGPQGPRSFANAAALCKTIFGRVADYGDWRYRILFGDAFPAPVSWWLGPITADNTALFVNLPNTGDFDGESSRFTLRDFACAHDK
jgi:hypothetical protein